MEEIKKKKEIFLDLSDTEKTARVCKALSSETRLEILKKLVEKAMTISELADTFYMPMSSMCLHIKTLKEADLISVIPKPGLRGSQKLCGIKAANINFDVFSHIDNTSQKPPAYIYMPVGHYSACQVHPPCGIASSMAYLYQEDTPYGFYSPNHTDASLLWLTKGFLEYQFPNFALTQGTPSLVEFSFEICSEAPGYNNNWPSDITLEINHIPVTTFMTKGDYGGRKGIYNPSWWSESNTQFGEYKRFGITPEGCYMNEKKVSSHTLNSLGMLTGYCFTFTLKVSETNQHIGGMNLFGKHFGDYNQDIIMKVEYHD
ncbi:MAG: helix-turn-helix domain-containing protein [Lachnospiraceae bacterium]|nr:helix-turn-helix domain-containing protein [Lachnospiraceae bacterium]